METKICWNKSKNSRHVSLC